MKKILMSSILVLMVILLCSCASKNADDRVIEVATSVLEGRDFVENRTFSVVLDDNNIYHVDINGEEMLVEIERVPKVKNVVSNITACDTAVVDVVEASRNKIVNYINESEILRDKDELIAYINNLEVEMAHFSEDAVVEYDSADDVIFVNRNRLADVSEWFVMHEFVDALSQKTNAGTARYQDSIFNEILAYIMVREMEPTISENEKHDDTYFHYMYLYLGCFGIDAIEAYFYGYADMGVPEEQMDVFVDLLPYVYEDEVALIVVCNFINHWGLEKNS